MPFIFKELNAKNFYAYSLQSFLLKISTIKSSFIQTDCSEHSYELYYTISNQSHVITMRCYTANKFVFLHFLKQIKLFLSFNNQGHAVIKEYKKLSIFSGPSQQYSYNTPPAIRIPQTINFFTYRTI